MENRNCQGVAPSLSRSHSSKRLKFKEVPLDDYNELNSKYQLYKRGSPNCYAQDINALKVRNIRNDVATTELSAVQSVLNQLAQTQSQAHINQRNYDLYPNLLKQPKARYKEMLSEKQEINDFVLWFEGQMMAIDKSSDPFARKFENKQTLIAAGFTQMVGHVGKISKNRAEILKMLWNRQNEEVSRIIDTLNGQSVKKERTLLQQISKLHQEYQNEIDTLRKNNRELQESLDKEKKFNRTLIENLRILRKRMKKLEYLVKKLSESNASTKRENLNLIEENIKLLMSIRQISSEEAVILNYRRLQVYQQKERLKKHKTKKILELADVKEEGLAPIQQLDEKKKALYDFFLQRLKENPDEKIFIKEQYFTDEEENVVSIEEHFKNIINRPHIKMQLLNEGLLQPQHKERAVNTDIPEQVPPSIPQLCLEKGIQVHIVDSSHSRDDSQSLMLRKLYQMMGQRQEEQIQKQSKKRIIQHRLSRKNSLTLLEIQGLTQAMGGKGLAMKHTLLSNFGRKNKSDDINQEEQKKFEFDSQIQSQESDAESQTQILAINKLGKGQLTAINIPTNIVNQRKSIVFNNLLQKINDTYERNSCGHIAKEQVGTKQLIKLDQEQQQEIKYNQLEDLIIKHLMKHEQGKSVQNPQKYLNKLLLSLYKNVSMTKRYNFVFQLLQVIRNSQGNNKSIIWKFLNIVTVIKTHSNTNSLLKIVSIFLKINDHYATYSEVNHQELQQLYFKLFILLSIRTINQSSFNLWKARTSLQRIKSLEFQSILQQFFSRKKRSYVENKIEEMVMIAQHEGRKGNPSTLKKIETQDQNVQIVKLNPILLYILQVYLIEKETYHASYKEMLDFASSDGHLSAELLVWLIDFMAFDQQRQNEMISFLFRKENISESGKSIKNDYFYRFCLKFDLPLFEELAVATYGRFKQLPEQLQQRYFRIIGIQEWNAIRQELTASYSKSTHSQIYFKAFILILDKLQGQIKRGASIYGEQGQQNTKRKQQVFSLFYKIAIIEAHKHTFQENKSNESRYALNKV